MKIQKFRNINHVEVVAELALQQTYNVVGGEKVNLYEQGWRFKWDVAVKRMGQCRPKRKEIGLSKPIIELNLNKGDEILDVILHEIAHALEWAVYKTTGHGMTWRNIARNIGCTAEVYYSHAIEQPKTKWTLKCPSCGRETYMAREPKIGRSCGKCGGGVYNSKYKLKLIKNY